MSFGKRITALLASLTIAFSASGCGTGKNTSWAAKYDSYEVKAGIFIYYEMSAYYQAVNKAAEENEGLDTSDIKAVKASVIDGKDILTWIQDEATESIRKYLAVQAEFDNRGLSLSDEEIEEINNTVNASWDYYGSYYEQNGIGKESFKQITELAYKSTALFKSYYSEGGTDEVPIDDVKSYYNENYARVKYIAMNLKDAEGNALDDEAKAERKKMAENYVERANKGEDFDSLYDEYNEYLAELTATEASAAETESATETETDIVTEIQNSETDIITEKDIIVTEAEAANNEDNQEPDVTAAAEESANSEDNEEPTVTTVAEEEITSDSDTEISSDGNSNESETQDSNNENSETAEESSEASEISLDTLETEEETDNSNLYANEQIIKKGSDDSYTPSEIINKAIFECKEYEKAFFVDDTDNNTYYVIIRYDILERTDLFEDDSLLSILNEIKGDDYDKVLLEIVTSDNVTLNNPAYKRYNPFNFEV